MPLDSQPIESKPDVFSLERLAAWLEMQNPETEYEYRDAGNCLLCRYGRACGLKIRSLARRGYYLRDDPPFAQRPYPSVLADIAIGHPRTYGAALSRARALLSERADG